MLAEGLFESGLAHGRNRIRDDRPEGANLAHPSAAKTG
jgi:hypothetical protein